MDFREFHKQFAEKMDKVREFVEGDKVKTIMGVEAVAHFQESFDKEGFTDETLESWQDVKRRDPSSPWYGHNSQGRGKNRISPERMQAKILTGNTSNLRQSIYFKPIERGVRITSPKPYGRVHQFGLPANIYDKKPFIMPQRPFMGKSKVLKRNIEDKITNEIKNILKQ